METETPLVNGPVGIGAGCIRSCAEVPKELPGRVDHITFGTFNGTGDELQHFLDHELHTAFKYKQSGCAVRISVAPRSDDLLEAIRLIQNTAKGEVQRIDMLEIDVSEMGPEEWEHILAGTTQLVCPIAFKIGTDLERDMLERLVALSVRYDVAEIVTSGDSHEHTARLVGTLRHFIDRAESLVMKPQIVGSGGVRSAEHVRLLLAAGVEYAVQISTFYKLYGLKGLKKIRRGLGIEPP